MPAKEEKLQQYPDLHEDGGELILEYFRVCHVFRKKKKGGK
jgi:hypothetical protein